MRIALGVEYDGSAFAGWQSQAHGRTIQDALERALGAVAGTQIKTTCAGRTDAGVHAFWQVVHFDTDVLRPATAWVRGTNAYLPAPVAVRWAMPVADDFHARYSAKARSYRYLLLNRPVRPGIMHDRVGWCHAPLDVGSMADAAACLTGEHDFSAFRAAECQAKNPVKTLHSASIYQHNDLIIFDFTASAFLHHMVRNLVGALVHVGKGRRDRAWLAEVLDSRDRSRAAQTFGAAGLYLTHVDYDPQWRLPAADRMIASVFPSLV
jgi:tRNA pseudouridine38-40 synthase